MNQSVKHSESLLDAISDYLETYDTWERDYRPGGSFSMPGRAFPLVTRDGRLYVWGSELAARIGAKSYLRELEPICTSGRVRLRYGLFRGSYREIDLERLLSVRPELAAHVVKACSGDTHTRLGLDG